MITKTLLAQDISNPAWGCGPDQANPDRGAQRRGQGAAWFRPKYECWIAVPTCPFTFDLFDLRPVAMITGRITFLRPAATATGRTAQSCTRFSDQNVYVTSRSMWEHSAPVEVDIGPVWNPGTTWAGPGVRKYAPHNFSWFCWLGFSKTINRDQSKEKKRSVQPLVETRKQGVLESTKARLLSRFQTESFFFYLTELTNMPSTTAEAWLHSESEKSNSEKRVKLEVKDRTKQAHSCSALIQPRPWMWPVWPRRSNPRVEVIQLPETRVVAIPAPKTFVLRVTASRAPQATPHFSGFQLSGLFTNETHFLHRSLSFGNRWTKYVPCPPDCCCSRLGRRRK